MLSIIDRYISKLFLSFFVSGILIIMSLFLIIDFMGNISRFDTTLAILSRYYLYYGFEILYQITPVAALVGVVFTLSILNSRNELTSLYSMGMSLRRILTPILVLVSAFVVLLFFLGDQILPIAKSRGDYIFYVEMQKKPELYSTLKSDKIWYRLENSILNVGMLDSEKSRADNITIYYFSNDWKIQQIITAKEASIKDSVWTLKNGSLSLMIEDMSVPMVTEFKSKQIPIASEINDLQTTSSASELLSFKELNSYIARNKHAGLDMTKFEVDFHNKLSFPFTIFVLALVGVPFVIKHQRSGGMAKNIGLVLAMTILFQIVYSVSISLGKHGVIYPFLSAWSPNILMLSWTLFLFRKEH